MNESLETIVINNVQCIPTLRSGGLPLQPLRSHAEPGCPRHLPEAGVKSQRAALEPGHATGEVPGWRLSRLLQGGLRAAF